MFRLLGGLARTGAAAAVFLLVLTVLRFGPVYAEPPWPLARNHGKRARALHARHRLGGGGGARRRFARPRRPWEGRGRFASILGGLLAGSRLARRRRRAAALGGARRHRGRGRSSRSASSLQDRWTSSAATCRRCRGCAVRASSWAGELRAPESGTFTLWAEGRGRLEVRLDGWPVLEAEGDPLHGVARVPIQAGPHRLEVRLEREAPGARLRFGWVTPSSGVPLVVPPRALGPEIGRAWWFLTDLAALAVAGLLAALVQVVPWTARRALPATRAVTRAEVATAAVGYAVLLAVMSWPLVTDPAHLGMTDRPDGRLNAWILAWDVHALTSAPSRLFEAPAFHPLPDALAFSENLLLPAVLSAPFQWLGGPVLAYNAALFLSLLVSGLGTAALVRRVSGDRLAAFVAGALFAAGAHRWIRLAHLHAQVTLFLPFALLALDHFWEDRRWRSALLAGLLLALQGWSSVYLGAITALALGGAVLVMLAKGLPARDLAKLAAGGLLAAALLLPAVRPYLRMRAFQGMEFTLAGRGDLRHHAGVVRGQRHSSLRGLHPAPPRARAGAGHPVPRPGASRPRPRRAGRGAPPLPGGGRPRLGSRHPVLPRARHRLLPLPPRARRARARGARALALLAPPRLLSLRPDRPGPRRPGTSPRSPRSRPGPHGVEPASAGLRAMGG